MELDWRSFLLLALFAVPWDSWGSQRDPVTSVMWDYYHERLLGGEAFVFDERVKLSAPPFAEDARQVPIQIDASAFDGQVVRMLAWAELNPIPQIFDFQPGEQVLPRLAIRIRVEQATPLRVAVLTRDGLWHVGSTQIDAAGGGCTAPVWCAPRPVGRSIWVKCSASALSWLMPTAFACRWPTRWTTAWSAVFRNFSQPGAVA